MALTFGAGGRPGARGHRLVVEQEHPAHAARDRHRARQAARAGGRHRLGQQEKLAVTANRPRIGLALLVLGQHLVLRCGCVPDRWDRTSRASGCPWARRGAAGDVEAAEDQDPPSGISRLVGYHLSPGPGVPPFMLAEIRVIELVAGCRCGVARPQLGAGIGQTALGVVGAGGEEDAAVGHGVVAGAIHYVVGEVRVLLVDRLTSRVPPVVCRSRWGRAPRSRPPRAGCCRCSSRPSCGRSR